MTAQEIIDEMNRKNLEAFQRDLASWEKQVDELLARIERENAGQQEFCLYCGAGVGRFRRAGEGTCSKCKSKGEA